MSHLNLPSNEKIRRKGLTLIDAIARLGAVLAIVGVVELLAITVSPSKTQAPQRARAEAYARNKMAQLLAFCGGRSQAAGSSASAASTMDSAGLPGCTERNGSRIPLTAGSLDAANPVARYVDYLDVDGHPVAATSRWEYVRVWQISVPPGASAGTEQIAVKAQARLRGANGLAPASTVVTTRSFPLR